MSNFKTTKAIFISILVLALPQISFAQNPSFEWAKQMGGTGNDAGESITTDNNGNIYTTGSFYGTVDFDPGSGTTNLTSAGSGDIFIQKLDASGNLLWIKQMGGITFDIGYSITTDNSGNIYSTGNFEGTADFDPGSGIANLTSVGNYDIFIQKLGTSTASISKKTIFKEVSIYPNPTQDIVNINLGNLKDVSIKVFNVRNQLIYYKENINTPIYKFELKEAAGVYFIELNADGEKQQYKLIKGL
ncbi:SBBP repeat-containing protein [Bacteroidota bacterium]